MGGKTGWEPVERKQRFWWSRFLRPLLSNSLDIGEMDLKQAAICVLLLVFLVYHCGSCGIKTKLLLWTVSVMWNFWWVQPTAVMSHLLSTFLNKYTNHFHSVSIHPHIWVILGKILVFDNYQCSLNLCDINCERIISCHTYYLLFKDIVNISRQFWPAISHDQTNTVKTLNFLAKKSAYKKFSDWLKWVEHGMVVELMLFSGTLKYWVNIEFQFFFFYISLRIGLKTIWPHAHIINL